MIKTVKLPDDSILFNNESEWKKKESGYTIGRPDEYPCIGWTVIGNPTWHENECDILVPIQSNEGHQLIISDFGISKIEND